MKQKEIIIYSTESCSHCISAKEFFVKAGLEFVVKDVEHSEEFKNELISLGSFSVPVILIDGKKFNGFDKEIITEALAK